MSTMPAKHHQPLHNFTLPFLKWGHRLPINHHCRRRSHSDHTTRRKPPTNSDDLNDAVSPNDDNGNRDFNLVDVDVATAVATGDSKPWNLRPRRLTIEAIDNDTLAVVTSAKTGRLVREDNEGLKRRLWISLSKEEIEEDIYAFTGSRPVRRPKKRSKTEQKQLDDVFPGLYLVEISADTYRV